MLLYDDPQNKYSINALVAALQRHGYRGNLHLAATGSGLLDAAARLREKYDVLVIGMSMMTTQLPSRLGLIEELRKAKAVNTLLVLGGPHASGDPAGTILSLGFDVAFLGEAEETLPRLVEALEDGDDLSSVRGIVYRCGDRLVFTGKDRPVDLDRYPPFPYWERRFGPIEITRGCPWGCRYCQVPYMHGALLRHRSVEAVAEVAEAFYRAGMRDLRFISPDSFAYGGDGRRLNFDALAELVETLHRLAQKYGGRLFFGTFPSEVRPEFVTDDTMRLIKGRVANTSIIFGAQSGSERMLKLLGRGHGVEAVLEAVETAKRHGFRSDVDFIFGLPGETREDIEASLALAEKLVAMGARIHAHTFLPLPGSPLADAPPGKIPGWAKKRLYRLIGLGGLYGQWEQQERLAQTIAELRGKGIILGRRGWRLIRAGC